MSGQRLNLFAMPSQTSILFYLLVAVLWGAILSSMFGAQVIPLWPLGLLLFSLPFHGFLLRPDVEKQKHHLGPPCEGEYPYLLRRIEEAAHDIGLARVPVFWIDRHRAQPIYSLGTFRRWYVVINTQQAQKLEDWLSDSRTCQLADVQILHELFHFRNGDIWKLGLLTEVFRYSLLVMGWALLFMLGFGIFLIQAKASFMNFSVSGMVARLPVDVRAQMEPLLLAAFPSPQALAAVQDKARSINLLWVLDFAIFVTLPYVALAVFLWLFYRPLLWRAREYYADAGVFHFQKSTMPFLKFVLENKKIPFTQETRANSLPGVLIRLTDGFELLLKFLHGNFWPDFGLRWQAYQSPQTVFYTWKQIGWILGGLLLALEIFLATPLTLALYGANPLLFPSLVGLAGLGYFFLPHVALGKKILWESFKALLLITLIRTVWMLLTLFVLWASYFVAPDYLTEILSSAIASTARYAGTQVITLDLLDFLLNASVRNLVQIPLVFLLQAIGLALLIFGFRHMLAWYGYLNTAQRFANALLAATAGVCTVLGFLVLSVMSILKGQAPTFPIILGLLATFLFGSWFYRLDRRHYSRCPICQAIATEQPHSALFCWSCHTPLLPWLVINNEE
jgi:hypothetical protein